MNALLAFLIIKKGKFRIEIEQYLARGVESERKYLVEENFNLFLSSIDECRWQSFFFTT